MKKRILSCLLAASMTVAWLPSAAMAAETEAGTEAGTESMTEAETEQEPEFDVADYLTINDDKRMSRTRSNRRRQTPGFPRR